MIHMELMLSKSCLNVFVKILLRASLFPWVSHGRVESWPRDTHFGTCRAPIADFNGRPFVAFWSLQTFSGSFLSEKGVGVRQAGRFKKTTSIHMHAGCIKRSYGVVFSVLWIRQMDTGPGSLGSLPQCWDFRRICALLPHLSKDWEVQACDGECGSNTLLPSE